MTARSSPPSELASAEDVIWERVLRPLGLHLLAHADDLGAELVERVRAEWPDAFPDEQTVRDSLKGGIAGVSGFGRLLAERGDPHTVPLEPQPAETMREAARRGTPLSQLMRHSRLSHAAMFEILIDQLSALSEDREQFESATRICGRVLFIFVNRRHALREEIYTKERERVMRSAEADRMQTLSAVLAGHPPDEPLASRRLGYPLTGEHLGICAWVAHPAGDPGAVEELTAEIASRLGAPILIHPLDPGVCAAWVHVDAEQVARRPGSEEQLELPAELSIGLGEPAAGPGGFRRTHAQALHARQVALLSNRAAGSTTRYGKVAIEALASADVETTEEFVARELGPLLGGGEASEQLAQTLQIYLLHRCSRRKTAQQLGLHENTVANRIRRAEQILGRSVRTDTLNLAVALRLASITGSRTSAQRTSA